MDSTTTHYHMDNVTTTMHVHDTTTMDHSGHNSGNTHDGMMKMYLHGGYSDTILFTFWQSQNVGIFILSCIIIFVIAVLYEGLKLLREIMLRRAVPKRISDSKNGLELANKPNSNGHANGEIKTRPLKSRMLNSQHIIQTLLHMLQVTVSYFLMLVVMTFNSWLCACVVLGAGLGYFLFGHLRRTTIDINECCH